MATKEIGILVGKTLKRIENSGYEVIIELDDGTEYEMSHSQDCCESVRVEEIHGYISDLVGSPILIAEEVTHEGENPEGVKVPEYQDSFRWTFYKLATIKGSVTIRWYGSSNGYYSERVDFFRRGESRW